MADQANPFAVPAGGGARPIPTGGSGRFPASMTQQPAQPAAARQTGSGAPPTAFAANPFNAATPLSIAQPPVSSQSAAVPQLSRAASFTAGTTAYAVAPGLHPLASPTGPGTSSGSSTPTPSAGSAGAGSLVMPAGGRTLADFVQEFLLGPQLASFLLAAGPHAIEGRQVMPAPPPLRSCQYAIAPSPPPVLLRGTPAGSADAPSASPVAGLPSSSEAAAAAYGQQWTRLMEVIPPTSEMLSRLASGEVTMHQLLTLSRCRIAALVATQASVGGHTAPQAAVLDCAYTLSILLPYASSKQQQQQGGTGVAIDVGTLDALCSWVCLQGELMGACGAWREGVAVLHGLIRFLTGRVPDASHTTGASAADPTPVLSSWAASSFSSDATAPIVERAIAFIHGTGSAGLSSLSNPPSGTGSPRTRILVCAAIKCAEALASMGYSVAARNVFSEALDGFYVSPQYEQQVQSDVTVEEAVTESTSFASSLVASPAWLHRGLLLSAQAQLLRSCGKEQEAAAVFAQLETTPGWGLGAPAMVPPGQPMPRPGVDVDAVRRMGPMQAYAVSQSCTLRGSALLQGMRLPEALPYFELAIHACARVLHFCGHEAVTAAFSASSASASLALASSYLPLSCPDPLDILSESAVGLSEAIRRGPPAGALPPSAVSIDMLHAIVRACPLVLGRPNGTLAASLCSILEQSRDPMMANVSKRVLHGVAHRYDMTHVQPSIFRIAG